MLYTPTKGRMKNPVKHPRRRFLQKQIIAFSCKIFLKKAPSQTPDWVRNTPLQRRDHNAWQKPMANSFTISKLRAINLGRRKNQFKSSKDIMRSAIYSKIRPKYYNIFSKRDKKQIKENLKYTLVILYIYVCIYTYIHT